MKTARATASPDADGSARRAGTAQPEPRSAISVRQATMADLDTVVSLRLALVREHANNPIYKRMRADADERARALYTTQLRSEREAMFLAIRASVPVGILRVVESAGSVLLDPTRYGYLSSVYVVPGARRRGILARLMTAAEEWCEARGLDELRLHSAADNPLSNATWDNLGFTIVEHVRMRPLRR
jgi:ribosomal protein S18 acetylase RimI-like enzyme